MYTLKMWCIYNKDIVLYFGPFREKGDAYREFKVKLAFERSRDHDRSKDREGMLCSPDGWDHSIESVPPEGVTIHSSYISLKRAAEQVA